MKTLAQHLEDTKTGQNEFARVLGVHPSLLSRYIAEKVDIPLDVAVKVRDATDGDVPLTAWPKLAAVIAAAQVAK
jgi:DNA-binding transcriptional regulator YdaS (Cro superfamily)